MQITVKSLRVLKTGTGTKGDWELIGVTSEDGTNYGTFSKGAKNIISGTVIDIGEPVIDRGKISFKEYTVVSAPASVKPETMTPELWSEKDRIQRHSIERQTSIKCACEIASNGETIEQILETAGKIAKWIANK